MKSWARPDPIPKARAGNVPSLIGIAVTNIAMGWAVMANGLDAKILVGMFWFESAVMGIFVVPQLALRGVLDDEFVDPGEIDMRTPWGVMTFAFFWFLFVAVGGVFVFPAATGQWSLIYPARYWHMAPEAFAWAVGAFVLTYGFNFVYEMRADPPRPPRYFMGRVFLYAAFLPNVAGMIVGHVSGAEPSVIATVLGGKAAFEVAAVMIMRQRDREIARCG